FEAEGGRGRGPHGENPVVLRIAATPRYFDAIGMTLLDGRAFDERDSKPNAPPEVMVNETFARHFWGAGSPVGKRIRSSGAKDWSQVVGFLRDEKHYGLDQEMKPSVFHPYAPMARTLGSNDARSVRAMGIVIRSSIDPAPLTGSAREAVRQLDPDIPI